MKLLLSVAFAVALATQVPPPPSEDKSVRVAEIPDLATCDFNRILPSPSAQQIVAWAGSRNMSGSFNLKMPGEFVVAQIPDPKASGQEALRITGLMAGERLEPLRWNVEGDKLLFRVGEKEAGIFHPADHGVAAAPSFDPLWSEVRIQMLSHGDTAFYRNAKLLASLRRIQRDGRPLRSVATIDGISATFLVLRSGNGFDLTGYEGTKRWTTGVTISFASAPLMPRGGGRRPTFMGDQADYRTFLPYAMPLINLSDGRIEGRFGWERVESRLGPTISLGPVFHQLINIRDAVVSGGSIFALLDMEREMRVVLIEGENVRSWRLCEKKDFHFGNHRIPAQNSLAADTPVRRTEVRFAEDSNPARAGPFGHLYRPVHANGDLVVYFHGGPTATLAENTVPPEVSTFARGGVSVLEVEYSGMLGAGLPLSQRLRRFGMRALREDVDLVTRWVRQSGFGHVYLIGDSFGGMPAVIAAVEHDADYEHFFLRAPFLALREPAQTVKRGQLLEPDSSADTQLEFELAVYGGTGGRRKFAADQRDYVQRLRPSPKLSFYFGGIDPVSAVSDLPAAFTGHRSVMIIPHMSHENVTGTWEIKRHILSRIYGCDTSENPAHPSPTPALSSGLGEICAAVRAPWR